VAVGTLRRLDGAALREGALRAAVIAVPAGVVAQVLDDGDDAAGLVWLLGIVVLIGLMLGASVAARRQREGTPLTHGIMTAAGVFVIVQALGVLRRTLTGDDITWSRIASSFLVSVVAGVVGATLGSRSAQEDKS